jgi:hypothetical protein
VEVLAATFAGFFVFVLTGAAFGGAFAAWLKEDPLDRVRVAVAGACGGGGGDGRLAVLTSFTVGTLATGLALTVGICFLTGFGAFCFAAIRFSGLADVFVLAAEADSPADFFADDFGFSIGCSGGGNSRTGPLSPPAPPPEAFCMLS